tara:strand:- start:212 stop:451 length:240 start_codon:yes stop_codon:yes gene_type:complete
MIGVIKPTSIKGRRNNRNKQLNSVLFELSRGFLVSVKRVPYDLGNPVIFYDSIANPIISFKPAPFHSSSPMTKMYRPII